MVDGVMLLVDASEGPLPQTRYVLGKALEAKLPPIVVINKIDRVDARPQEVLNEIYDLFIDLDAKEDQLEFPILYTNAKAGTATTNIHPRPQDLEPLFDAIVKQLRLPRATMPAPSRYWWRTSIYSDYLGRLAIARVFNGKMWTGEEVSIAKRDGSFQKTKITKLFSFSGLKRVDITETELGDIVAVAGVEGITIGETITNAENPAPLPPIVIDEPTIAMMFTVNTSPFSGREGNYVTSRNLRDRLTKELLTNVSLRVEDSGSTDSFKVLGRGELQLSIYIEMMRREGFELMVGKPEIVTKRIDGKLMEPVEHLIDRCQPFASLPVVGAFTLEGKRPGLWRRIGDEGLQICLVEFGAVGVAGERPDVVGEYADRPATALPDKNPGRARPPFPRAEQLIGPGRQQKYWPCSDGETIECSAWRKVESFGCVAQTGLRARAWEQVVLAEHYGEDCSRNHMPVGIERERYYRLDVHEPL